MVVDRGVLKGGPMKVFREGICLVLNFWWEIRCFVDREHGSDPNPWLKLDQLRHHLFHWFIQSNPPPSVPSATIKLKELISFFEVNLMYLDNSLEEVSEQLVVMYHECLQGDFTSVEIILEANLRPARQLIRPNVVEANSSGVDASRVFRQGIGLLMENLWVRRVFIHDLCHSNPHPMLQQLADEILFWFTQTIKPLSFAYLERILRNELYSLPIDYQVATNGITKEVATKLMLMHKECLQGNFSSVEILGEESLNQDKEMSERIGVAPPKASGSPPKGYTIALDKCLAADGRGLQEVQINDNFAKVSEALYVGEQKAREAVAMRSKVQKEMLLKEKERKEQELRALAQKARSERICIAPPAAVVLVVSKKCGVEDGDMRVDYGYRVDRVREEREKIRVDRQKERERERRLEAKDAAMGKKSKITKDSDRDISEELDLGFGFYYARDKGHV